MDRRFTKTEAVDWVRRTTRDAWALGIMYKELGAGSQEVADLSNNLQYQEDLIVDLIEELYNGTSER